MKKFLGTATTIAVAFTASAALAGVYNSGPLTSEFSNGPQGPGYVSPNPDVFKAAGKASKSISKLASGLFKCYSKGAGNVSKGKPSGVDTCVNNSKKGVVPKYLAGISKQASKSPLPACHNFVNDAAYVRTLVKTFNPNVYCQSPSSAFLDNVTF